MTLVISQKIPQMKPVKIIEFEGDFYVIPNHEYEGFMTLIHQILEAQVLEQTDEYYSYCNQLTRLYSEYMTGGDLNNQQFYIK